MPTLCATHGVSSCPPLCAGGINVPDDQAQEAAPASDAPASDGTPVDVAAIAADQRAREVGQAIADVDGALARIAATKTTLADLTHAIEYIDSRLDDATAILKKYRG